MLKLDVRQNPPRSIWLVTKVTVGKNPQNDIMLNVPGVDDFHVAFIVEGQSVFLIDKSTQGTFINGERVTNRIEVKSGDWITVGDVEMDIIDPKQVMIDNNIPHVVNTDGWVLRATTAWLAGQEFPIEKTTVVGRSEECDITISGTHLSLHHAEITVQENSLHIKDLDSANGTFLNGVRITEADVVPGDEIRFDLLSFLVLGPELVTQQHRLLKTKTTPDIKINTDPAVRVGEAKPTSMGNSEEFVEAYNQQLNTLKKEKKRKAKREKIDIVLGWLIIVLAFVLIGAIIYYSNN